MRIFFKMLFPDPYTYNLLFTRMTGISREILLKVPVISLRYFRLARKGFSCEIILFCILGAFNDESASIMNTISLPKFTQSPCQS